MSRHDPDNLTSYPHKTRYIRLLAHSPSSGQSFFVAIVCTSVLAFQHVRKFYVSEVTHCDLAQRPSQPFPPGSCWATAAIPTAWSIDSSDPHLRCVSSLLTLTSCLGCKVPRTWPVILSNCDTSKILLKRSSFGKCCTLCTAWDQRRSGPEESHSLLCWNEQVVNLKPDLINSQGSQRIWTRIHIPIHTMNWTIHL